MSYRTKREEEFTDGQSRSFDKRANEALGLSSDEELKAHLASWEAPDPPRSLDLRVMDDYRRRHSVPFWKRATASSIRVPLPVAAAAALLVLASSFLSLRSIRTSTHQEVANQPPPQVQIVEVPVVQEKIVTRTVYVEKSRERNLRLKRQTRSRYIADVQNNAKPKAQDERPSDRVFTRADLSGFQPVGQVRIEVIRGTRINED